MLLATIQYTTRRCKQVFSKLIMVIVTVLSKITNYSIRICNLKEEDLVNIKCKSNLRGTISKFKTNKCHLLIFRIKIACQTPLIKSIKGRRGGKICRKICNSEVLNRRLAPRMKLHLYREVIQLILSKKTR